MSLTPMFRDLSLWLKAQRGFVETDLVNDLYTRES